MKDYSMCVFLWAVYLSQIMHLKFTLFTLNWIRVINFHILENVLCVPNYAKYVAQTVENKLEKNK